jgi:hypothetical protein
VQRVGEVLRKMWNTRNFKGQVSPHELMQAIMKASNKRFIIDKQVRIHSVVYVCLFPALWECFGDTAYATRWLQLSLRRLPHSMDNDYIHL